MKKEELDPTLLAEFFDNLEKLLNTGENHDVVIHVGSGTNAKEIHAHSSILSTRCSYLKDILSNTTKENGYYVLKRSNFSELVIKTILRFLYACKLDLNSYTGDDLLKLLLTSDELGLQSLYKFTQDYFIKNHESYIDQNTVKIVRIIDGNENFNEIRNICLEKICIDSDKLFQSNEFQLLEKSILLEILEKDDLYVEEINIWENILKWGLAKHSDINSDNNAEDWSLQNFADFEKTIKEYIFLIRFIDISNENFFHKVMPYQMLFPRALWRDISHYYLIRDDRPVLNLLPSRNRVVNSMTITQKVTLLLASWVDKKTPPYNSVNQVKYRFKLLYRSSRDGLNTTKFHQKCDDVVKTFVVAKILNSDQLVGGYNSGDWKGSGQYKAATGSFIFNIGNRNDIDNTVNFSYDNSQPNNTVYCHPSYLPTFGSGHDLQFTTSSTINSSPNTYNNINILNGSGFDELEVFQVIAKN